MAQFKYKALGADGEYTEGIMGAADRDVVISRLRANNQMPVMVAPQEAAPEVDAAAPPTRRSGRRRRPSRASLTIFTRELQTLLEAGLSLDRALEAIAEASAGQPVAELVAELRTALHRGRSLSQAMADHPESFDGFAIAMVRAGETGGSLDGALGHLAAYQERSEQIQQAVRSALTYPVILVFATLLSLIILMTLVVPQFEQLFREAAVELPASTRFVLWTSALVQDYGWLAAAGLLVGWLTLRLGARTPKARARWDVARLRLPVIGPLVSRIEVERFARSLAALLGNGVSLPVALEFSRATLTNRVIGSAVAGAAIGVKRGERLADALASPAVFPPLAIQLIRVGEEGGNLAGMLLKLADILAAEIEAAMKRLVTLIEPSLIIVIGCVVAFVVISLLSAILEINALAF